MSKTELVLSNTTTFFGGNIEAIFKKAVKHGFKYIELVPYRWVTPEQVIGLEKEYIPLSNLQLDEVDDAYFMDKTEASNKITKSQQELCENLFSK